MITNPKESKEAKVGAVAPATRYIGVASVQVVAINPNNAKLRSFGWEIPEDAAEPEYSSEAPNAAGKTIRIQRVRLLVQIQDFADKPVVPLDFFCTAEPRMNMDNTKCQIIDDYGRTAWATKEEFKTGSIPVNKDGNKMRICTPYRPCHRGEEGLIKFLVAYFSNPIDVWDNRKSAWTENLEASKVTFDNWTALCNGDLKELAAAIALQPNNRVKVVFGIRHTEDNRSYQTFMQNVFILNERNFNWQTGEYNQVSREIARLANTPNGAMTEYSSKPVVVWKETPSVVKDESTVELPSSNASGEDDLPF